MHLKKQRKATNWIRFAMKLGLLATDAAIWSSLGRMLEDRDNSGPAMRREAMARDLRVQEPGWSHTRTLLTGVGIGVGLGILFAPMSGEQARYALRQTAMNFRSRITDVADWAGTRWGSPRYQRRSTGTYAD